VELIILTPFSYMPHLSSILNYIYMYIVFYINLTLSSNRGVAIYVEGMY
jgi:hypothetical protein